jgi:tetratricopeptide (TPR) repeat protein
MRQKILVFLLLLTLAHTATVSRAASGDSEWTLEIISLADAAGEAELMSYRGGSPSAESLKRCLDEFKRFMESGSPHKEKFYYFYAKALNQAKKEQEAILWAERALKTPYNHVEAICQLPDWYERILEYFPRYDHNDPIMDGAGFVLMESVKRLLSSGIDLDKVEYVPLPPPPFFRDSWKDGVKPKTLVSIGDSYRAMGDVGKAVFFYEWAALRYSTGDRMVGETAWATNAYWQIGQTYEDSGDWERALVAYLKDIAFQGTWRSPPWQWEERKKAAIAKVKEMCARIGAGEKKDAPKTKLDKDTLLAIARLWRGDHHYIFAYEIYDQIEKEFKADMQAERAATLEEEANFLAFVTSRGCFRLNGELLTRARIERAYAEALKAYEKLGKAEEKKKAFDEKLKGLTPLIDYVPVDIDLLPANPRPSD